jgi:cytochrome c oxidase cbb3-type subunit III
MCSDSRVAEHVHQFRSRGSIPVRLLIRAMAGALVMALASCSHPPGDAAASAGPPPVRTPVGPVPGPPENPVRPANPYGSDIAAMAEGRTLFVRMNCSGCHGGRAGGGMGPSLRDPDWLYGSSDAQIFSTIAEGRSHGMPAWGPKLTDDQIWKLVAYVKSLRTPNEPQPPS